MANRALEYPDYPPGGEEEGGAGESGDGDYRVVQYLDDYDDEGPFERFLTSAIATILTIIFSWQILIGSDLPDRRLEKGPGGGRCTGGRPPTGGCRGGVDDGDSSHKSGSDDTPGGGMVIDGQVEREGKPGEISTHLYPPAAAVSAQGADAEGEGSGVGVECGNVGSKHNSGTFKYGCGHDERDNTWISGGGRTKLHTRDGGAERGESGVTCDAHSRRSVTVTPSPHPTPPSPAAAAAVGKPSGGPVDSHESFPFADGAATWQASEPRSDNTTGRQQTPPGNNKRVVPEPPRGHGHFAGILGDDPDDDWYLVADEDLVTPVWIQGLCGAGEVGASSGLEMSESDREGRGGSPTLNGGVAGDNKRPGGVSSAGDNPGLAADETTATPNVGGQRVQAGRDLNNGVAAGADPDTMAINNLEAVREQYNRMLRQQYSKANKGGFDASWVNSSDSSSNGDEEGNDNSAATMEKRTSEDESDESFGASYTASYPTGENGEREYSLGEQLGEDSSDSEYCVVFKRVLGVIKEEDADELTVEITSAGDNTDTEVHDIPADDESGASSDTQGAEAGRAGGGLGVVGGEAGAGGGVGGVPGRQGGGADNSDPLHFKHTETHQQQQRQRQLSSVTTDGEAASNSHAGPANTRAATQSRESAQTIHEIPRDNGGHKASRARSGAAATAITTATAPRSGRTYAAPAMSASEHPTTSSDELLCVTASSLLPIHRDGRASSLDFLHGVAWNGAPLVIKTMEWRTPPASPTGGGFSDDPWSGRFDGSHFPGSSLTITSSLVNAGGESGGELSLSESEATDSSSIGVTVEVDPAHLEEAARGRVYGGPINTHRPVTIGPYHDRSSQFARRNYIGVTSPVSPSAPTLPPWYSGVVISPAPPSGDLTDGAGTSTSADSASDQRTRTGNRGNSAMPGEARVHGGKVCMHSDRDVCDNRPGGISDVADNVIKPAGVTSACVWPSAPPGGVRPTTLGGGGTGVQWVPANTHLQGPAEDYKASTDDPCYIPDRRSYSTVYPHTSTSHSTSNNTQNPSTLEESSEDPNQWQRETGSRDLGHESQDLGRRSLDLDQMRSPTRTDQRLNGMEIISPGLGLEDIGRMSSDTDRRSNDTYDVDDRRSNDTYDVDDRSTDMDDVQQDIVEHESYDGDTAEMRTQRRGEITDHTKRPHVETLRAAPLIHDDYLLNQYYSQAPPLLNIPPPPRTPPPSSRAGSTSQEYDTAEDTSSCGRYRTPEGWSGVEDSAGEELGVSLLPLSAARKRLLQGGRSGGTDESTDDNEEIPGGCWRNGVCGGGVVGAVSKGNDAVGAMHEYSSSASPRGGFHGNSGSLADTCSGSSSSSGSEQVGGSVVTCVTATPTSTRHRPLRLGTQHHRPTTPGLSSRSAPRAGSEGNAIINDTHNANHSELSSFNATLQRAARAPSHNPELLHCRPFPASDSPSGGAASRHRPQSGAGNKRARPEIGSGDGSIESGDGGDGGGTVSSQHGTETIHGSAVHAACFHANGSGTLEDDNDTLITVEVDAKGYPLTRPASPGDAMESGVSGTDDSRGMDGSRDIDGSRGIDGSWGVGSSSTSNQRAVADSDYRLDVVPTAGSVVEVLSSSACNNSRVDTTQPPGSAIDHYPGAGGSTDLPPGAKHGGVVVQSEEQCSGLELPLVRPPLVSSGAEGGGGGVGGSSTGQAAACSVSDTTPVPCGSGGGGPSQYYWVQEEGDSAVNSIKACSSSNKAVVLQLGATGEGGGETDWVAGIPTHPGEHLRHTHTQLQAPPDTRPPLTAGDPTGEAPLDHSTRYVWGVGESPGGRGRNGSTGPLSSVVAPRESGGSGGGGADSSGGGAATTWGLQGGPADHNRGASHALEEDDRGGQRGEARTVTRADRGITPLITGADHGLSDHHPQSHVGDVNIDNTNHYHTDHPAGGVRYHNVYGTDSPGTTPPGTDYPPNTHTSDLHGDISPISDRSNLHSTTDVGINGASAECLGGVGGDGPSGGPRYKDAAPSTVAERSPQGFTFVTTRTVETDFIFDLRAKSDDREHALEDPDSSTGGGGGIGASEQRVVRSDRYATGRDGLIWSAVPTDTADAHAAISTSGLHLGDAGMLGSDKTGVGGGGAYGRGRAGHADHLHSPTRGGGERAYITTHQYHGIPPEYAHHRGGRRVQNTGSGLGYHGTTTNNKEYPATTTPSATTGGNPPGFNNTTGVIYRMEDDIDSGRRTPGGGQLLVPRAQLGGATAATGHRQQGPLAAEMGNNNAGGGFDVPSDVDFEGGFAIGSEDRGERDCDLDPESQGHVPVRGHQPHRGWPRNAVGGGNHGNKHRPPAYSHPRGDIVIPKSPRRSNDVQYGAVKKSGAAPLRGGEGSDHGGHGPGYPDPRPEGEVASMEYCDSTGRTLPLGPSPRRGGRGTTPVGTPVSITSAHNANGTGGNGHSPSRHHGNSAMEGRHGGSPEPHTPIHEHPQRADHTQTTVDGRQQGGDNHDLTARPPVGPDARPQVANRLSRDSPSRHSWSGGSESGSSSGGFRSAPWRNADEGADGAWTPRERSVIPHSLTEPDLRDHSSNNSASGDQYPVGVWEGVGYPLRSPRSCTALATSTALARKDSAPGEDFRSGGEVSRPVVSAVGNAQATGDNPYVAVARATARAATIASANAAAGVAAKMPRDEDDVDSGSDINVVISTSCMIRDENLRRLEADSHDVIGVMGNQQQEHSNRFQQQKLLDSKRMGALPSPTPHQQWAQQHGHPLTRDEGPEGPKKMVITIEQEGSARSREKKSQTVECELPQKPNDANLSHVISSAVKQILKSSSSSGSLQQDLRNDDLNDVIERVTQQVVQAYTLNNQEGNMGGAHGGVPIQAHYPYHQSHTSIPPMSPTRRVANEAIPSFRGGPSRIDKDAYRQLHNVTRDCDIDDDDGLLKYAIPVNSYGHRLQYASKYAGQGQSQDRGQVQAQNHGQFRADDRAPQNDATFFYVTGTGPKSSPVSGTVEEVVITVARDNESKPTVEHIMLSETESGSEAGTPVLPRRGGLDSSKTMADQLRHNQYEQQYQQGYKRPLQRPDHGYGGLSKELKPLPKLPTSEKPPMESVASQKKIRGILRSTQKPQTPHEANYRQHNTVKSTPIVTSTLREKKSYESVLLRSVHDRKTPLSVAKRYESPEKEPTEQRSKLDDARKGYLDMVPKNPPWPKNTVLDAAFEDKKRKWFEKPNVTPNLELMVVDIDIDNKNGMTEEGKGTKTRSTGVEQLKRRLSAARLKAPNSQDIDQRWNSVASLKPYKSQGNLLDRRAMESDRPSRTRNDSTGSTTSQDIRRVRSLGTLPSQFFSERRSYTSLMETDLDTGICTTTPLIYETDLDQVQPGSKAKSLTNLSMNTSMMEIDIDEDRCKSMDTLPREGQGLMYSLPAKDSDNSSNTGSLDTAAERSLSAGELRITKSLNKLSIPDWYRSSFGKGNKAIELPNTRHMREASSGELLDSSLESMQSSYERKPPLPNPVVIQHRVTNTIRVKSPTNSAPTTPVDKQQFKLPSSRLKQTHIDYKPMTTKRIQKPPVQVPKKQSAKEAYLRLKAECQNQQGLLEVAPVSQPAQTSPVQSERTTKVEQVPAEPGEWYVAKTYISLTPAHFIQNMSLVEREHTESGDDSGLGPSPGHNAKSQNENCYNDKMRTYDPGTTCTELIEDMKLSDGTDIGDHTQVRADHAHVRLLDNIEASGREIKQKAHHITTDKSIPGGLINRGEPVNPRQCFPVLSYVGSPSSSRKKQFSAEQSDSERDDSNVKISSDPTQSTDNSLDHAIRGLLSIPDGSEGAQTLQSVHSQDFNDGENVSPKSRVFRMLRQAATPHGSMISVNTSRGQDYLSDPEETGGGKYEDKSPVVHKSFAMESEDKLGEQVALVKCSNPKCKKSTALQEARRSYKTCHNCYTYYCSRDCRKAHWECHKRTCLFSRVNSVCKHIVKKIHDTSHLLEDISRVARTGYMSKGRGCVLLAFSCPENADAFLENNERSQKIEPPPGYANLNDLEEEVDVLGEQQFELFEMCRTYNPDIKFVIEIVIVAGAQVPAFPVPRREGPAIKKCARLRLSMSKPKVMTIQPKPEPETLILTALPGSEFTENMEEKKAREICFVNIQRKLRQRGVSLRHHFPEVYQKLCAYVADNTHFTPITIYPLDVNTGKRFMCLIMPNAEPEVEWMYNPDLLDELGLATQV